MSCDNFENTIIDTAKAYLHYGVVETVSDIFQRIDALTPQVIQETAQELFQLEGELKKPVRSPYQRPYHSFHLKTKQTRS